MSVEIEFNNLKYQWWNATSAMSAEVLQRYLSNHGEKPKTTAQWREIWTHEFGVSYRLDGATGYLIFNSEEDLLIFKLKWS